MPRSLLPFVVPPTAVVFLWILMELGRYRPPGGSSISSLLGGWLNISIEVA